VATGFNWLRLQPNFTIFFCKQYWKYWENHEKWKNLGKVYGCLWEDWEVKKANKPTSTPSVRRHEGQSTAEQAHQSCRRPESPTKLDQGIQVYPGLSRSILITSL